MNQTQISLSAILLLIFSCAFATVRAAETSAGTLLVCNKGDHTLAIVDPVAGTVIATVPEDGVTGHEVVASPDGQRAFVPIYGNAGVGRPADGVRDELGEVHSAFMNALHLIFPVNGASCWFDHR